MNVPRKSVYDAELYRVFVNWLKHVHSVKVTGQWHLKQLGLIVILELIATASCSTLNKHFLQIFNYAQQLHPQELWIVHFSREDNLLSSPHWPSEELQRKG
jgi:hypothetical protein